MKQEDFEGMLVNPYDILKSENPLEEYKVFGLYKEFKEPLEPELNINKVLSFIVCVYDKNSPLQTIDDVIRKKGEAADISGFPQKNGAYLESYLNIIQGGNEVVNKMTIAFCRIQGSHSFTQMVIYNEKFYEMILQLKGVSDPQEQKTLMANIQYIKKNYDEVKSDFLAKDSNKYLDKSTIDSIEFEQMALRPEHIAELMQKGEEPVNIKPFGKGYKFQKYSE